MSSLQLVVVLYLLTTAETTLLRFLAWRNAKRVAHCFTSSRCTNKKEKNKNKTNIKFRVTPFHPDTLHSESVSCKQNSYRYMSISHLIITVNIHIYMHKTTFKNQTHIKYTREKLNYIKKKWNTCTFWRFETQLRTTLDIHISIINSFCYI